jgi:hypothetical protein
MVSTIKSMVLTIKNLDKYFYLKKVPVNLMVISFLISRFDG